MGLSVSFVTLPSYLRFKFLHYFNAHSFLSLKKAKLRDKQQNKLNAVNLNLLNIVH